MPECVRNGLMGMATHATPAHILFMQSTWGLLLQMPHGPAQPYHCISYPVTQSYSQSMEALKSMAPPPGITSTPGNEFEAGDLSHVRSRYERVCVP